MKYSIIRVIIGLAAGGLLLCTGAIRARAAIVVNFDDLTSDTDLTGSGYAGLTWEPGGPGLDGLAGYWYASSSTDFPHSLPYSVINAAGSTRVAIGFPVAVNVQGAYIAGQGDPTVWTTSIRVDGYRGGNFVGSSPLFTSIAPTPTWFDMGLGDVDRIVFVSTPVFFGGGWFGMDDLTYTTIPEPLFLPIAGLLGAICGRRQPKAHAGNV